MPLSCFGMHLITLFFSMHLAVKRQLECPVLSMPLAFTAFHFVISAENEKL